MAPTTWHASFSGFLREVVGRSVASATTEKKRLKYLTDFVFWWRKKLEGCDSAVRSFTPVSMLKEDLTTVADWTPKQVIEEKQRTGFSVKDWECWGSAFNIWSRDTFTQQARGIYKPKNQLDGFLRFIYQGKYKHRRYKRFTDYLIGHCKKSPEEAQSIIENHKKYGLSPADYAYHSSNTRVWQRYCDKQRATAMANVRWKKYRAAKAKNIASAQKSPKPAL